MSQKLKRLEAVTGSIHQVLAAQKEGQPIDRELANAVAEEQRLRNWIASHQHRKP